MPMFAFHCEACDNDFETLARVSETPPCPRCGAQNPSRLLSRVAPELNFPKVAKAGRAAAMREGHLSNFSKSERGA
ncbi:zinc ribbon domain-containing protein [Methylocella sp.]|uniref:zinc ribbon domain-containing protein n=1 Tax=Methylocella sp. TaxID=1978226 RepID=UPI0037831104